MEDNHSTFVSNIVPHKEYKGRVVRNGMGDSMLVALYGPRNRKVEFWVNPGLDGKVLEFSDRLLRVQGKDLIEQFDRVLAVYDGPKGIWEEERRLR